MSVHVRLEVETCEAVDASTFFCVNMLHRRLLQCVSDLTCVLSAFVFVPVAACVDECKAPMAPPCLHNGTCVDQTIGYKCDCVNGYVGLHCENGSCRLG